MSNKISDSPKSTLDELTADQEERRREAEATLIEKRNIKEQHLEKRRKETLKRLKGIFAEVKWVPIDEIVPYEKNPKKHPREQVEKIAMSITNFGWDQPIVVDGDKVIIKGHGRHLAAQHLKMKEVPIVIRTDMTENEVRASRIADNQTAESYWHIGNLIREIEALYGADKDLTLTGYSEDEIKKMCPGLLEDSSDFSLTTENESIMPSNFSFMGADGLIGTPVLEGDKGAKELSEWVSAHDRIIVPFSGDRTGLAAICWCASSNIDISKVTFVDTFFGQRVWRWHNEYLDYIAKSFEITIQSGADRLDDWLGEIREKGWPNKSNLWCCNKFRSDAVRKITTEDASNTVIIWGDSLSTEGKPVYRQRGIMPDTGVHYAAPLHNQSDDIITDLIQSNGVLLNPLYKITDLYLCPGCPRYEKPDFVFLKSHDLDLWIRWLIYFGKSQTCKEYVESEEFKDTVLNFIGDNIEPREYGTYRDYAHPLPECPQPVREVIYEGDDYGWDAEEDKKLDPELRLDRSRGAWFRDVGTSQAYKDSKAELEEYHKKRGDTPLEEWLEDRIREAKELSREEVLVEDGDEG